MSALKKNKIVTLQLLLAIVVFTTNSIFAQDTLTSLTFIGTGEYHPTVIDANKIYENPAIVDSTKKLPTPKYAINSKKINTNFNIEPIAPAQMVGEPLTKLYNNLAKVGMGTYTSPYLRVWPNMLRSKDYAYGMRLKHFSSSATLKDYGFAGFSDNEINFYGKKFLKEHSLIGN